MGTITSFDVPTSVAALTFDDGPNPTFTKPLLELLQEYDARATFFMVGDAAAHWSHLVQSIALAGHAIGNHSWDHRSFASLSRDDRRRQIVDCANALSPHGTRLFRPPWGHQTGASRWDALWLGHEVVCWNVDVGDWWDTNAKHMADQLIGRLEPGSIILLHDAIRTESVGGDPPVHYDRGPMLAALRMFLEHCAGAYRFVTVPEMFKLGPAVRHEWFSR